MTIFITGTSGYIGGMLADFFSARDDVEELICLDKSKMPTRFRGNPKVLWIRANTVDTSWQHVIASRKPDVVIHCAWQIREHYFKKKTHEKWNMSGTRSVFHFIFSTPGIKHFIHLSTVAAYGAYPENSIAKPFREEDPLREDEYLYGAQKRMAEEMLKKMYDTAQDAPNVTVLRISSVTGERYKKVKKGMTLQNILAHTPYIPVANADWGRQFVYEEDLVKIFDRILSAPRNNSYEVFNIAPPGFMNAAAIVHAYGKRALRVPKELMRYGFFIVRHLSLGRMPTSRGGWKFYVYPLAVDGSKISRELNLEYRIH